MRTKTTRDEFERRMSGVVPLNMSLRSTVSVDGATAEADAMVRSLLAGITGPTESLAVLRPEFARVKEANEERATLLSDRYQTALKNSIESLEGAVFRENLVAERQALQAAELERAETLAGTEDPVLIRLHRIEAALRSMGIPL